MISQTIRQNDANMRLDRLLRQRLPLKPLSEIYRLIRQGSVKVNGKKIKENHRLQPGEVLEVQVPPSEWAGQTTSPDESIANLINTDFFKRKFHVLYEDEHLLVCNKPDGLVVHPGTGHLKNDTLIDLAKSYLLKKQNGEYRDEPVLVHRIDRDTSGVILLAKNKSVLRSIHEAFRGHEVEKRYLAICHGKPAENSGTIEADLSRTHDLNDGMKMRVDEDGLHARTTYSVVESHGGISKLIVEIDTGRTHQIRVHLAHIGCPIVGDVRYGDPQKDQKIFAQTGIARRLYLHARMISIPDPHGGKMLTIRAPEPPEFFDLMRLHP